MLPLKIVASGRTHSDRQEQAQENKKGIKQDFAVQFKVQTTNWQISLAGITSGRLIMCAPEVIPFGQVVPSKALKITYCWAQFMK